VKAGVTGQVSWAWPIWHENFDKLFLGQGQFIFGMSFLGYQGNKFGHGHLTMSKWTLGIREWIFKL
jgi:hypothetical protein